MARLVIGSVLILAGLAVLALVGLYYIQEYAKR
jgi:hypothetical protein